MLPCGFKEGKRPEMTVLIGLQLNRQVQDQDAGYAPHRAQRWLQ
jgi:hypothetical protein